MHTRESSIHLMKCIVHNAALDASNPCLDVNVDLWVALADADLCARFDQAAIINY